MEQTAVSASPEPGTARNFPTIKLLPESDHVPTPTCAPSIALLVTCLKSQPKPPRLGESHIAFQMFMWVATAAAKTTAVSQAIQTLTR